MFYLLPLILLLSACSVKETGTPPIDYNLTFEDINLSKIIDDNITTTKQPPKVSPIKEIKIPKIEDVKKQQAPARPGGSKVTIAKTGNIEVVSTDAKQPIFAVINGGSIKEFTTLSTTVRGKGVSSTGTYTMYSVDVKDVKELTISISTKPNASIRTIVSPFKMAKTNNSLKNGTYGIPYLDNKMSTPQTFLQRDPYAIKLINDGIDTLYIYFAIDNDNTNSYFNAKSCKLGLGISKK